MLRQAYFLFIILVTHKKGYKKTNSEASESRRLFHEEWPTKYEAIKHNNKAAFAKKLLLPAFTILIAINHKTLCLMA